VTAADSIVPDDKDWTWVLSKPCPECGFDTASFELASIPTMIVDNADSWVSVLEGAEVAVRPAADRWSPLEYACHVRDVFSLYDYRLHLMLDHDDPMFPNWDQDATAIAERYDQQDPAVVSTELTGAAQQLADSFAAVDGDQWQRTGNRSDGAVFTIESFARYMIHDPIHHLADVTS
jgi:DinB superfamily